jgi:DNA replication protein DnaC
VLDCPEHGKQKANSFLLFGKWTEPFCPVCMAEKAREADERNRHHEQRQITSQPAIILKYAKIPKMFANADFSCYKPVNSEAENVLRTCKTYAEDFQKMQKNGAGLLLLGSVGTGKTHLACSIMNSVIKAFAVNARFFTAPELTRKIKDTYRSKKSTQEAIDELASYGLLVIDELGVQLETEHEKNLVFEVINARYEAMNKPTIVVSNLDFKNLSQYIGERVMDRLCQNGKVLNLNWGSYRKNHTMF